MRLDQVKEIKGLYLFGSFLVNYYESGPVCTIYCLKHSDVRFAFDLCYKKLEQMWLESKSVYDFHNRMYTEYKKTKESK